MTINKILAVFKKLKVNRDKIIELLEENQDLSMKATEMLNKTESSVGINTTHHFDHPYSPFDWMGDK